MKLYTPSYYNSFACTAGDCKESCCRCWEVVIDQESQTRYEALPGELGNRLRASLRQDSEGDSYLALTDGRCPMLNEQGLCCLQLTHGESALSLVCRNYPRFHYDFGGISLDGLSISCPEVCRLVLETPFSITEQMVDAPPTPNDLDPALFYAVLQGRDIALQIAGNQAFTVRQRATLLLAFGGELEQQLSAPAQVLRRWQQTPLNDLLPLMRQGTRTDLARLVRCFDSMEHLNPQFPSMLTQITIGAPALSETAAQRLLQYYLYKYVLQAAYDGKFLGKIQFCTASLLLCDRLYALAPQHDPLTLYAREMEHSEENLRRFARWASRTTTCLPALLSAQ